MADAKLPGGADQARHALVEHRVDHHEPRGGRALLAGEPEGRVHDGRHSLVQVRVRVDDQSVLAPQLGYHPRDVSLPRPRDGRGLVDGEPDRLRPGEHDERDIGVFHEAVADVLADAGQEAQHPGRKAASLQRRHQLHGHRGRLLGRLQDDRVAGHEGGAHHAGRDRQREVPRGDHDTDALPLVAQGIGLSGR